MAEAVASAAAVIQFLDVAIRLSSSLAQLCADVRNVPLRFQLLQTDLYQQIAIVQDLQASHIPDFVPAVSSSPFDTSLLNYIAIAEELRNTLEKLLDSKTDGPLQQAWTGFFSIRKKDEIDHLCDRLEQNKSTLLMWLCAANLALSSRVTTATGHIKLNTDETLSTVRSIEDSSKRSVTVTEDLAHEFHRMSLMIAGSSQKQEQIMGDIQQLMAQSPPTMISLTPDTNLHSRLPQAYKLHDNEAQKCTCRTVNSAQRWQTNSILRFTRTFRTQHFSYCAAYRSSEQTLEFSMQLIPPAWLLSHTIDLGVQVKNWWSMRPLSINPIVIGTSRLIDSKVSPAFRAIKNTEDNLLEYVPHSVCIKRLRDTLEDLFEQHKASALDTDRCGRTLLNEVLRLYSTFPTVISSPGDEYVSLIQFLLDKGADPNTIRSPVPRQIRRSAGGTIFDQFAVCLMLPERHMVEPSEQPRNMTIFKRLEAAGCQHTRPLDTMANKHPKYRSMLFAQEVEECTLFEDQIDICEFGEYVPLILQQNEKQFERAVRRATLSQLNRKSPIRNLTPIHFAALWAPGLKALIEKGVKVNPEDFYGRRPIHIAVALGLPDSVELLIRADCALYCPPDNISLLQHALGIRGSSQQQIVDLVIAALINRHSRLLNNARTLLPPAEFSTLDIGDDTIHEQKALLIAEMFAAHSIDVSEALELDDEGVYDCASMHGQIRMSPHHASSLYRAGFTGIDVPNANGLTPLLQSFFCANFEMVAWFVDKGVELTAEHEYAPLTALHMYAKRLAYPGAYFSHDAEKVPTDKHYMAQLHQELNVLNDDCTCVCSPVGCSPVKFLLDTNGLAKPRRPLFRQWLAKAAPSEPLLSQQVFEATRSLLFEFLGGKHTCCRLGQEGAIEIRERPVLSEIDETLIQQKTSRRINESWQDMDEHQLYCLDGLPIPRRDPAVPENDAEGLQMTLDTLMSLYDEMPRPDTMLPDEQPFQYINWLVAQQHMIVNVAFECDHFAV